MSLLKEPCAAMPRLSALSRGTGELDEPSSARISIRLDPSDISGGPRRRPGRLILKSGQRSSPASNYMPPPGFFQPIYPRLKREATLPKTYSTKKGALVLFSEDLAHHHHQTLPRDVGFEMDRQQLDIKTTDLTVAITRFEQSRNRYNRFVRTGNVAEIKPGHSARRHIAAWHLSHPEVNIRGALGTTYSRKPEKRGRKHRIIRTSLTVFPPPYNLPKTLGQIKHGITSNNIYKKGKTMHVDNRPDSLASSLTPQKKLAPIDSSAKNKERTSTPQVDHGIGQASTTSSDFNSTKKPLPPIFKNPSSEGSKVTNDGSQRTSSGATIRKRVRIQLEPVVVPDGSPLPYDSATR